MRYLVIATLLACAVATLAWNIVRTTSTPAVNQRPRLVNTIRDEGEPCVSGPRLTPGLLEEWPAEYDNACVEIRLDVRCDDDCGATLPSGRRILVDVAAAMHDVQIELRAEPPRTLGLLGRFRSEPQPSLSVSRVLAPWW